MATTKKKVTEEDVLEEYKISEQEMLMLELHKARAEHAYTQLQLAQERFQAVQNSIAGKYSEYGKYKLVGEVDQQTLTGKRKKVDQPGS